MRMRRHRAVEQVLAGLAAATGAVLLGFGVRALVRRLAIRRHRGRATTPDAAFVMAAVQDHVRTITLGEVAGVRAEHNEVRDFAQLLVEHHTQALTDLAELAGFLGVGIETQPSARLGRQAEHLKGQQGIEVDRTFIHDVVDHHRMSVRLVDEALQSAASADLQAYARAQLPHLQAHLRVAEDIAHHLEGVGGAPERGQGG